MGGRKQRGDKPQRSFFVGEVIDRFVVPTKRHVFIFYLFFALHWFGHRGFAETGSSDPFPAGIRDFAAYWAAARLLLAGSNPYSPSDLFALQRSAGMAESAALIMWNPPWMLSFLLPLGLLDFPTAQFLWLLFNVSLILFSAHQLLRLYGGPKNKAAPAWLLAFAFVPTIYSLVLGQVSPIILFALTTFLLAERRKNWLAVSLILVVMSIKPHFLYLFWLAIALWLWRRRDWRTILSAAAIGSIAGLLPLVFHSRVYANYLAVYQSSDYLKPFDLPVPSLRNVAKVFFGVEGLWIEFLSLAAGAIWLLIDWRRSKERWVWTERMPLILLVSIVTSPYSWTYDHVVLLPAIIQTYSWLRNRVSGVMIVYLLGNAAYLALRYVMPLDFWYFWMAPLLLALYLWLRKQHGKCSRADVIVGAPKNS